MANKVICFSKDRPLQLQAYLESLHHYVSNIDEVFVIIDRTEYYEDLIKLFPKVVFVVEDSYILKNFDAALRDTINRFIKPEDLVLFGTDDVVFSRSVNLIDINNILNNQYLFGFSMRLWPGIVGANKSIEYLKGEKHCVWRWFNSPSHFGYPFDLSTSAYIGSVVIEICNYTKDKFRCPNDLESRGVNLCYKSVFPSHQYLMSFSQPHAVIVDINLTVDTKFYNNRHQGDPSTTVQELLKKYNEGFRIDWKNYSEIEHNEPFIGLKNFKLIKAQND